MATTETTAESTPTTSRGISKGEMEILSAFNSMIQAREINKNVDIQSISLEYSVENGYNVSLVEVPKENA